MSFAAAAVVETEVAVVSVAGIKVKIRVSVCTIRRDQKRGRCRVSAGESTVSIIPKINTQNKPLRLLWPLFGGTLSSFQPVKEMGL